MKRIFSLITAVLLSWFIYHYFLGAAPLEQTTDTTTVGGVVEAVKKTIFTENEAPPVVNEVTKNVSIPDAGIELSSLSLKPEHEAMLKKVGIDVETFVITKEMMACAEGEVGSERVSEYINGSSPTLAEMTGLIGCLKK